MGANISEINKPPSPVPVVASRGDEVELPTGCPISNPVKRSSECPVSKTLNEEKYKNPNVYNVYNQKVDPTNQMPSIPQQGKNPHQSGELSVHRVPSLIPKAGTDDATWLYPSQQMFWNAMVRKNKAAGAREEDMDVVVSIHNNMNEKTWKQVLAWEELHPQESEDRRPKLLRFLGRPHDLSPKAYIKTLFGHPRPFDRHDWYVDRGGREIRYVIDYYHNSAISSADKAPTSLTDIQSVKSIMLDVRPALDSVESIIDRLIRMPFQQILKNTGYSPPPFFPSISILKKENEEISELGRKWAAILDTCATYKVQLDSCSTEGECRKASLAMQKCTAKIICPNVVQQLDESLNATGVDDEKVTALYLQMSRCLEDFNVESRAKLS